MPAAKISSEEAMSEHSFHQQLAQRLALTRIEPVAFETYLRRAAVPVEVLEDFLAGASAKAFDPEFGYTLNTSHSPDGMDGSWTIATVGEHGARRIINGAGAACRINTYGNSFTQGSQCSDGETWQEYLAAHLGEPVRNFGVGGYGVYQAYRRMLRNEEEGAPAENLILYIWGDDHLRSLFRCRWALLQPVIGAGLEALKRKGITFHGNFWCNIELDVATGAFRERDNPLASPAALREMTDPDRMVALLHDDLALELHAFKEGYVSELAREPIQRLAEALDFDIDWAADVRKQAGTLLDQYALRATLAILDKANAFARGRGKNLLVVLFDPYRAMQQIKQGEPRYDQCVLDHLQRNSIRHVDMNLAHIADAEAYKLSWPDYMKRFFVNGFGHYNPIGAHFFAYKLKDTIVDWLDPKPITYRRSASGADYRGYLADHRRT
jgi:hypothetical protein